MPSWFPSWLKGGAWMSNTQVLAAGCHFLISSMPLVLAFLLFGVSLSVVGWMSVGIVVFGFFKEFWYDKNYETPTQTFAMNLQDFLGYCAGTAFAWGVVGVKLLWLH